MFAALIVARLREAVSATDQSSSSNLRNTKSWVSADDVPPTELPLAKATEKVLASMHTVLEKTIEARDLELASTPLPSPSSSSFGIGSEEEVKKREHLRRTKAAEIRLVRNVRYLREPAVEFKAKEWEGDY
ncbi:hypothetical protein BDW62DRAFT_184706 [Aspergillus aurantiobrunneus]